MSTQAEAPPANCAESQQQAQLSGTIALLTLSCIFVGLRFIVRYGVVKGTWWDDWTIFFALVGTIVGAGLDFVELHHGYALHRACINDFDYNRFAYYSYGEWIQTFATLMWTKISICLFLYRIPVSKAYKRPLLVAVAALVISNVILTLLWILQCLPVAGAWDIKVQKDAKCFTKDQLLQIILAQGIISAISDFSLALYPILLLANLQMSWRKKLGLSMLMGFGVITGACCVVRCVINWSNESEDSTWDSMPNWMWRLLEVNFGIAAACIPALYPGYLYLKRRWIKHPRSEYGVRSWKTKASPPIHRDPAEPAIAAPDAAMLRTTANDVMSESVDDRSDVMTTDRLDAHLSSGSQGGAESSRHGVPAAPSHQELRRTNSIV